MEAVDKTNLVDQVQERVLGFIRERALGAGDALPSELELCETLGVSRPVVREALSRLRMLGIIDSRQRRGLVVAAPDVFGGCRPILDAAFLDESAQQDLGEMRMVLELGIPELLFLHKTEDDLVLLHEIIGREVGVSRRKDLVVLDIEFHTALYRISGNKLLNDFQALLQAFFEREMSKNKKPKLAHRSPPHQKLLDELECGTADSFRAAMKRHLAPYFEALDKPEETL